MVEMTPTAINAYAIKTTKPAPMLGSGFPDLDIA
jgi:hypothetical protein